MMIVISIVLIIAGCVLFWHFTRMETPHQRFVREVTSKTILHKRGDV
jgi:beta-lactam-binding protein with PASTA domain